ATSIRELDLALYLPYADAPVLASIGSLVLSNLRTLHVDASSMAWQEPLLATHASQLTELHVASNSDQPPFTSLRQQSLPQLRTLSITGYDEALMDDLSGTSRLEALTLNSDTRHPAPLRAARCSVGPHRPDPHRTEL